MSSQILITGASGHLGQRVLSHLLDTLHQDPRSIIAASRRPDALDRYAARGVTVRTVDFENASSLSQAFEGAGRVLLISTDALDRPGRRLAQHRAAISAAEAAGVQHVVYTSMPEPDVATVLIATDHAGTEAALVASQIPGWTILRNHWYFENLLQTLPGVWARGGQWYSAAGEGRIAHISRDDLARAAAVAVSGTDGGKHTYTLSGGEAITTSEQAAIISAALGIPLTVVPVPIDALIGGMVGAGIPEPVARVLASFDQNTADGHVSKVTDDYRKLVGRSPLTFEAWVESNKSALAGR